MSKSGRSGPGNLIAKVTGGESIALTGDSESMWMDVIHKMDEVYSDLLRYESDLEWKNKDLEEAQTFISSVIASVSDILVVVDGRGLIQQINPAFLRLLRQPESEILGSPIADFIDEADRPFAMALLIQDKCTDERNAEMRFMTALGVSDLMAVNCSARLDHLGRRMGTVLTGRPIGELRRAYEALHKAHLELQHAQRKLVEQEKMASLGRLVAGVAHELNNPISFVYGNIHTLERYRQSLVQYFDAVRGGDPDASSLRQSLKIDALLDDCAPLIEGTLEGAARVSEIVRNLRRLSFSKTGDRQSVDLEKIIRTASHWASRAKKTKAEIDLDLTAGVMIDAHEGQIHQVAVNMIDNALDAVRGVDSPKITITLRKTDRDALITVADNGPGIAPEAFDKIFEPFFTTKVVGEGTGLGLWISYTIVQEHAGTIIAANGPNGGAFFTVTLPLGG